MAKDYDRYVIEPIKEIETPHAPGTFITGFVRNDNKQPKNSDAPGATSNEAAADAGSKAPEVDAASTPAAVTKPAAAPADPALISGSSNAKYHEAGYDAFITGQAYLRFAGY